MGRRIAIAGLLITGIVNALHYARKIALDYPLLPGHPEALRDLVRAATWADGWMGLMAIIGAIGLWRRREWGALFGIVAAAGNPPRAGRTSGRPAGQRVSRLLA